MPGASLAPSTCPTCSSATAELEVSGDPQLVSMIAKVHLHQASPKDAVVQQIVEAGLPNLDALKPPFALTLGTEYLDTMDQPDSVLRDIQF